MIITAATPRLSAPPRAQAAATTPAAPQESVDFSSISTPQKAAVLPALNPIMQFAVLSAMSASAMSYCGMHATLAMNITSQATKETTQLSAHYSMKAPDQSMVLRLKGQGKVGEADFQDEWALNLRDENNESLRISGHSGNAAQDVTMSSKNGKNSINGKIGDVSVQLAFGEGGNNAFTIDGQLADAEWHTQTQFKPSSDSSAMWTGEVSGTLGDAAVKYAGTASILPDRKGIALQQKGTIGGYDFDLSAEFRPDLKK